MTKFKQYNPNTGTWELIGLGATGPAGPTGPTGPSITVRPPDRFNGGTNNGTATTWTTLTEVTNTNIFTAASSIRMVVSIAGITGANAAPTRVWFRILDEAGNILTPGGFDGYARHIYLGASNDRAHVSLNATKDYTAGQTVGYQVQYYLDTSNIYIHLDVVVEYWPR